MHSRNLPSPLPFFAVASASPQHLTVHVMVAASLQNLVLNAALTALSLLLLLLLCCSCCCAQPARRANYYGTAELLQLASEMPHLRAFVFTSTYFTNNYLPRNSVVREHLHCLPLTLGGRTLNHEKFVQAVLAMAPEEADRQVAALMASLNFTSTYAFGKLLTEHLVSEAALRGVSKVKCLVCAILKQIDWCSAVQQCKAERAAAVIAASTSWGGMTVALLGGTQYSVSEFRFGKLTAACLWSCCTGDCQAQPDQCHCRGPVPWVHQQLCWCPWLHDG